MRSLLKVVVCVLAGGAITGCEGHSDYGQQGRSADMLPRLPDPIVDRLGTAKAREIHLAGARRHVGDVRRAFGYLEDVRAQCAAAEAMLTREDALLMQRPLLLCAGSLQTKKPTLLVSGINPNRETAGLAFHFRLAEARYVVLYKPILAEKDLEMTLAVPGEYIRFAAAEELQKLAVVDQEGTGWIVIGKSPDDRSVIPLPAGVPIWVSVWDRSGLRSDAVPFHRDLVPSMTEPPIESPR